MGERRHAGEVRVSDAVAAEGFACRVLRDLHRIERSKARFEPGVAHGRPFSCDARLRGMSKNELEFANVVCKMGGKNLLDIADEYVLPVFFEGDVRTWGKGEGATKWSFMRSAMVALDDGEHAVAFEFVKDKKLKSEQFLKAGELVTQERQLEDAPSAIGLLVLSDHRLVYLPKTAHAPVLSELKLTIEFLMRKKRDAKIAALMKEAPWGARAEARKTYESSLPKPTCEIIQLSSEEKLRTALSHYEKIRSFSLRIFEPNPSDYEPGEELFEMLRESRKAAGAHATSLVHTSRDGLDRAVIQKEAEAAAGDQNAHVIIKGVDANGVKITQDNESLGLKMQADFSPGEPKSVAGHMYKALKDVQAMFRVKETDENDDESSKKKKKRALEEHLKQAKTFAKELFDKWTRLG